MPHVIMAKETENSDPERGTTPQETEAFDDRASSE